jgi:hypothetical protein
LFEAVDGATKNREGQSIFMLGDGINSSTVKIADKQPFISELQKKMSPPILYHQPAKAKSD